MARFTNQAQLRYGNAVANSNIAVGEILEVLAATKLAVRQTYGQNDSVTYIISIVNSEQRHNLPNRWQTQRSMRHTRFCKGRK